MLSLLFTLTLNVIVFKLETIGVSHGSFLGLLTRSFTTGYALRMPQVYAYAANESTLRKTVMSMLVQKH